MVNNYSLPLERFDYLLLINQRYFLHDYPAQRVQVFEQDIATICKVDAGKGP